LPFANLGAAGTRELARRLGTAFALGWARPEPRLVWPPAARWRARPPLDPEAKLKVKVTSAVDAGAPLGDLEPVRAPARALTCEEASLAPLPLGALPVEPPAVPVVLVPLEPAGSLCGPVAPLEPVEPVDPVEPFEPVEPVEPVEPGLVPGALPPPPVVPPAAPVGPVAPSPAADGVPVVASSSELTRALLFVGAIAAMAPATVSMSAIANISRADRRQRTRLVTHRAAITLSNLMNSVHGRRWRLARAQPEAEILTPPGRFAVKDLLRPEAHVVWPAPPVQLEDRQASSTREVARPGHAHLLRRAEPARRLLRHETH
jgi:hypothetical protein